MIAMETGKAVDHHDLSVPDRVEADNPKEIFENPINVRF